jgi:hypothetical protein
MLILKCRSIIRSLEWCQVFYRNKKKSNGLLDSRTLFFDYPFSTFFEGGSNCFWFLYKTLLELFAKKKKNADFVLVVAFDRSRAHFKKDRHEGHTYPFSKKCHQAQNHLL